MTTANQQYYYSLVYYYYIFFFIKIIGGKNRLSVYNSKHVFLTCSGIKILFQSMLNELNHYAKQKTISRDLCVERYVLFL